MCISLLFFSSIVLQGCSNNIEDVKKVLSSPDEDEDEVIEACYWILNNQITDTSVVKNVLTYIIDIRMSTSFEYYAQNPYQLRIKVLEKITGSKPPGEIKDLADASIIDHYLDWAIHRGLIKTKDDIYVIHPYLRQIHSSEMVIKGIINHDKVDWLKKYNWPQPPTRGKFHSK